MAQQPEARDAGHDGDGAFRHGLDLGKLAALGIGVEAVDMAAEDEPALVRLREIEELGPERDDVVTISLMLGAEGRRLWLPPELEPRLATLGNAWELQALAMAVAPPDGFGSSRPIPSSTR
jgi:hypothetical protein